MFLDDLADKAEAAASDDHLLPFRGHVIPDEVIKSTEFRGSFVENVNELARRYRDYGAVVLHGEVAVQDRDRAVKQFRENRGTRILVANPAAAREGLTLTEANVAIYVDRTFNLVDYLQSQDRIHRISQTKECDIILLMANSTIDQFIDFSLEQKHRLARFTQADSNAISEADLALQKPIILRALLAPDGA